MSDKNGWISDTTGFIEVVVGFVSDKDTMVGVEV
ncbi:hypothetical protein BRC2024_HCTLARHO_CDS_0064 [Acinetobacter phage vB_AbaS_Silvergun]